MDADILYTSQFVFLIVEYITCYLSDYVFNLFPRLNWTYRPIDPLDHLTHYWHENVLKIFFIVSGVLILSLLPMSHTEIW